MVTKELEVPLQSGTSTILTNAHKTLMSLLSSSCALTSLSSSCAEKVFRIGNKFYVVAQKIDYIKSIKFQIISFGYTILNCYSN